MKSLEAELDAARDLAVGDLADAIESIGFECTRCGACCTGYAPDEPGGAPAGAGPDDGDDGAGGFGEASSDGTPTSTGTSSGSFPSSGLAPGFGVPALLAALGVLTALALWRRP